jgi:hypothetical protein
MIEPKTRPITSFQVSDSEKHPVWQFAIDDEADDAAVRALKRLPVSTLRRGKLLERAVRFANGEYRWGTVCNLDARNPEMNAYFVTLTIELDRRWFHLQGAMPPGVAVPSIFNEHCRYTYEGVLCRKQLFYCAG